MKRALGIIFLVSLIALVTGCGSPAGSNSKGGDAGQQGPIKLKVGYDGFSMTTGPINYAQQKGIFQKYGLDVELVFVNGGSTLTQAVVGGTVDIGQNGYTPAAEAIASGSDLVFFGGISNKMPFQMVVKSTITGAEQLKGKKLAISKFGSSTDQAAAMALQSLGLKKSDVTILQLGGSGERLAAAMSGQIDGTMEQYPQTGQLLQKGFRVMVDLTDLAGEYPNTAYVAKRDFVKKNPEAIKKFMMAVSEGIAEYKKNRDEAIKLTAAFLKIDNLKDMEQTYDFYAQKIYPDIPRPSVQGIELVLKEVAANKPEAAKIKPEQIIDTTALDQLEKEGFFSKLKK